tara:strand:+ start:142 stop:357 length:216 start_codon:yes stop_codon:yes gene_type:complete
MGVAPPVPGERPTDKPKVKPTINDGNLDSDGYNSEGFYIGHTPLPKVKEEDNGPSRKSGKKVDDYNFGEGK